MFKLSPVLPFGINKVEKTPDGVEQYYPLDLFPTPYKAPIDIRYTPLIAGIVPIFEEHEARIEAKYTMTEWYDLDPMERALEVAHWRVRNIIQAHVHDAIEQQNPRR